MKISALAASLLLAASLAAGSAAFAAGGTSDDDTGAVGGGGSSVQAPPGTATNPGGSEAQTNPVGIPTGSGPIRNGHDIEPEKGVVTGEEKAAGIAQPPAQSQRETAIVERQANELIRKSQAETQGPPGSTESR